MVTPGLLPGTEMRRFNGPHARRAHNRLEEGWIDPEPDAMSNWARNAKKC
jgi:hypothetical protein